MYERIRTGCGLFLFLACVGFCVISGLSALPACTVSSYRTGDKLLPSVGTIGIEKNGMILVNSADAETLCELPGIGETIASLIIGERTGNGPFYYAEDLETVRGIGPRTLERIRPMIDLTLEESGE